ncbi:MAG TPA: AI-2E family transporter [Chitinophaga sp.]|uniref:AI-2E family transporter n=1 Tax=Chitinophaga sp. TaxID=1869181 RepID=UPI002CE1440E|nr:AI-2E family transporter [Chitinophaga sp.]HVI45818.1 AI-2E family transporter [Chitinophaga sp.]
MSSRIPTTSRRIIETVIILLLLLGLMYALYDVLKVFFGVFTFAIIFAVSFAKLFDRFAVLLGNRRKLAAVLYSILVIAIIALPFIYFAGAFNQHLKQVNMWIADARENGIPPLPSWITRLPYIGNDIADFWQQLQLKPKETAGIYEHQIRSALHHVITTGAGIIGVALQFIAGIIVSAIFLVTGEKLLDPLYLAMMHMFGEKDGRALINAAGVAVKSVAIGVMGTAFIAAIVSWLGFTIAGIPFALGLAALVYFLVLIQVGPLWVWIPLVIWMMAKGSTGWAIFLAIYGGAVVIMDGVLKPILIAKSGKLPFLVLFLGVIGGMVAWGFTGMFKGAIILAVFYTVFNSWLEKTSHYKKTTNSSL